MKSFGGVPLSFDENGTPSSNLYEDVYHSLAGDPEQAEAVFLRGNGLPDRWRKKKTFTLLETGFGLALNFLSTWKRWSDNSDKSNISVTIFHHSPIASLDN